MIQIKCKIGSKLLAAPAGWEASNVHVNHIKIKHHSLALAPSVSVGLYLPPLSVSLPPFLGRRKILPASCTDNGHIGIMTILYNNIGKDLSRVSMPAALNEPLSLLQRLSEELEYSALLDTANSTDDP